MLAADIAGRSKLIPIWFQIDSAAVAAISPLLADRVAIRGDIGVTAIASKIAERFPIPPKISGNELADIIENCQYPSLYAGEALITGCQHRFLKLNAYKEEYALISDAAVSKLSDTEIENLPLEFEEKLSREAKGLRGKHGIPEDTYLTTDESVRDDDLGWWMEQIGGWVSGTLSLEESAELVRWLDLEELDEYYILLEIPNFSISSKQRHLLERALIDLGCGYDDAYASLLPICASLRWLDENG